MWKRWTEYAPITVRLAFGGGFAYHGYPKLFTPDGHANIVYIMQGFGMPFPNLMGWIVGILEFFGGLALISGFFVATTSLLLLISMSTNVILATIEGGFPPPLNPSQPLPGYQDTFLYMSGLLALLIGGSGTCSITRLFVPRNTIS